MARQLARSLAGFSVPHDASLVRLPRLLLLQALLVPAASVWCGALLAPPSSLFPVWRKHRGAFVAGRLAQQVAAVPAMVAASPMEDRTSGCRQTPGL